MREHTDEGREIGKVSEHPAMPSNLSQESAKGLRGRGCRGVQNGLYFIRVHGNAFLTDDVSEKVATCY